MEDRLDLNGSSSEESNFMGAMYPGIKSLNGFLFCKEEDCVCVFVSIFVLDVDCNDNCGCDCDGDDEGLFHPKTLARA